MDVKVVLSTEEIVRGLKHYRRIAKQDLLLANETDNPEAFRRHAEARRCETTRAVGTKTRRSVVWTLIRPSWQ